MGRHLCQFLILSLLISLSFVPPAVSFFGFDSKSKSADTIAETSSDLESDELTTPVNNEIEETNLNHTSSDPKSLSHKSIDEEDDEISTTTASNSTSHSKSEDNGEADLSEDKSSDLTDEEDISSSKSKFKPSEDEDIPFNTKSSLDEEEESDAVPKSTSLAKTSASDVKDPSSSSVSKSNSTATEDEEDEETEPLSKSSSSKLIPSDEEDADLTEKGSKSTKTDDSEDEDTLPSSKSTSKTAADDEEGDSESNEGSKPSSLTKNVSVNEESSELEPKNGTASFFENLNATAVVGPDIEATGPCKSSIKKYCSDVLAGDAALVDCISAKMKEQALGNSDRVIFVPRVCKRAIRDFKILMYQNISMDSKLEKACFKDINKLCNDEFLYPEVGAVLACLREASINDQLSTSCQVEVFRVKEDASNDIAFDPQLNEVCASDINKYCKDVEPGEGRIQTCLRVVKSKINWDCQTELFRQEVENADDIRLNFQLFKNCLVDIKKFCRDIPHGDARVKDCLESNRLESDFSPSCKDEFDRLMERRASDFRLDSTLRKYCKNDIAILCYPDTEEMTDVANNDANIIECLQDFREELKDLKCKNQVHKLTQRGAEDIRFVRPLAEACREDRQTLCKDVPDGMAQVFRCLQDKRDQLKDICKSALFDQEVKLAEDIDFKFPMKRACASEIEHFCHHLPSGHAAVIKCLQENIDDSEMGGECSKEIKRDELRSADDYRFNYRLNKACDNDVQKLCMHACDNRLLNGSITCGGIVLKCLTDNMEQISSKSCKKEVFEFEKLETKDIRLDVPLQTACKRDLEMHCPKEVDHSRILNCLRKSKDMLSAQCKEEEERFSIMEASDIRLTPTLMNACGQELSLLCKDVPPSGGEAFKCLQGKLEDVSMGPACQAEVNLQEARHSSNYRLDVRVRKECDADAERFCKGADTGKEGHALVLRCFISKYKKLASSCKTEVSYAVRMALWQYRLSAELTKPCDENVKVLCSSEDVKPVQGAVIGVYGQCLLSQNATVLDSECKALVKIANKEGAHVGGKVDDEVLAETLKKIEQLRADIADAAQTSRQGLVMNGWIAYVAISALVIVLMGAAYAIYQKFFGAYKNNYTLVVKGGDV